MTTMTIDTASLEKMLGGALNLRKQPTRTLARAILKGDITLPTERLELPPYRKDRYGDNAAFRQAHFLSWLTGSGMQQRWLDAVVPALRNNVTQLEWIPGEQQLKIKIKR